MVSETERRVTLEGHSVSEHYSVNLTPNSNSVTKSLFGLRSTSTILMSGTQVTETPKNINSNV